MQPLTPERTSAQTWDVIVLGAGAAGLMCAAEAGRRGLGVLLLEHGERVGRKILISGGGRCNFTNLHCSPANFLSENPHFAKSALARYTPQDFVRLVEKHHIAYHHKTLGQLFCNGSAQAIVTMLEAECREAKVTVQLRTTVLGVSGAEGRFTVNTAAGDLHAARVVVATGGLSISKMGATGIGYEIARSFGLRIVEPRAALVPLVFSEMDRENWADLSGLSAEVIANAVPLKKQRATPPLFREKFLITHRGVSGPAVLQASSYWNAGEAVRFDLAPQRQVFTPMLEAGTPREAATAYALLREHLPQRMAERWLQLNLPADWKNASVTKLEAALHTWELRPAGDEGFAKAEVTRGGVSTTDLHSTTLQAKTVPGLAFVGEAVDVTGHLGGHNFQWAWASAVAAAAAL